MRDDWKDISILERRKLINAAYSGRTAVKLKVDEIEISSTGLRMRVGKNWYSQNINVDVQMPAQNIDLTKAKKGQLTLPSQNLNVRVSVSFS